MLDGARQLRDGMAQFDREGIHKLTGLLEDNGRDLIDRAKALKELSEEYTSFGGNSEKGAGTVRFIMRTDAIGDEE